MELGKINSSIADYDQEAADKCKKNWDSIAKPLGSLGLLENVVIDIAGLTGDPDVNIDKRAVVVMCADNGVVEEGVTQTGQDVTAIVASNIAHNDTSVCRMALLAKAETFPINMGMVFPAPGTIDRAIAPQTNNFTKGPAMTREQAEQAIQTGIDIVSDLKEKGYKIIATGEMGIGNTTTSSALSSVLMGLPVEEVTGRGAGLSDEGLIRKKAAIAKAIEVNNPDPNDALDCLAKLGGFDIAGMVGLFLGGAIYRVPILIDGFISAVSALVASRICPASKVAMFASHVSAEPAAHLVLETLGKKPLICAEMHLGEGTGAVCAIPLIDMALAVYGEMVTFDDINIEAYTPQGGE
ncbi:MAG: nicotinate-nucleotide--dimethylbenzimidazole phosphoribosyltransferase [Coriobacteriales bacterium]|jgi:nicotinate-nucleotide--dimethylbenzimidazole phosphoribosyltransferase